MSEVSRVSFCPFAFSAGVLRGWRVAPLWLVARRIPAMVHTKAPPEY